jgi:WD40 repeat protein
VDLRFARVEEQLDLNNASFRGAVADIASAIRGVPKDELESEEVRQHRRTVRTAWAAGIALLSLVVVASVVAVYANGQRLQANEQRGVAEDLAFEARTDALAAGAIAQLDSDPELALLLATESLSRETQPDALTATHQALQRHHTVFQIAKEAGSSPLTDGATGGMNPAGDLLAITRQGPSFEVWSVGAEEPLWTKAFESEGTTVRSVRFTTDGSAVVALVTWSTSLDPLGSNPPDDAPFGLFVYNAETGEFVRSIAVPACPSKLVPSPLPAFVDLAAPIPWVTVLEGTGSCDGNQTQVGLLDPATGLFTSVEKAVVTSGTSNRFGVPTIDSSGQYLAVGASGPGRIFEVEAGAVVFEFDGGISTLSADGSKLLAEGHAVGFPLELWDWAGDDLLWSFPRTFTRAWFSDDERLVYGTSLDGSTYVLDAGTGNELFRLVGHTGAAVAATMSQDGRRLATFGEDFTARVWDLSKTRSEGDTYDVSSQPRGRMAASADLAGNVGAVWSGAPHQEQTLWETNVFDLRTGDRLAEVVGGAPALSPDGAQLAYRAVDVVEVVAGDSRQAEPGMHPRVGVVMVTDLATGQLTEIAVPCVEYLTPLKAVPSVDCRDPLEDAGFEWDLEFSPDGSLLAMADSYNDEMVVWEVATGQTKLSDRLPGANVRAVAFTPDQQQIVFLLVGDIEWVLHVYDIEPFRNAEAIPVDGGTSYAEMVFTPDGSLLIGAANNGDIALFDATTWVGDEPIRAHLGSVLDVAVNPEGKLLTSAGEDGFVRVWNIADRSLVTQIEFDVEAIANVEFIDNDHLLVTSSNGSQAIVITLDPAELLNIARSRLTRSFTIEECDTYGVDPCDSP